MNEVEYKDNELSLVDIWNIVWRYKWTWLTFGPLLGAIGLIYALNATVYYRAETTLASNIEEQTGNGLAALAGQFGGIASMAGINLGGGNSTETALATLKSRQFLVPFLTSEDRLQILFSEEWDPEKLRWKNASSRRDESNKPTALEAYERFTTNTLTISNDSKTGIIVIGVELEDPDLAANWSNALVANLNAHMREQAQEEAKKNLAYLNTQINKTKVIEIKEALYSLIENQTKNAMVANAKEDYTFKVIDPAITPELKSRPKRVLIIASTGLLGGFFGLFLCFVLHFIELARKEKQT